MGPNVESCKVLKAESLSAFKELNEDMMAMIHETAHLKTYIENV